MGETTNSMEIKTRKKTKNKERKNNKKVMK